jgi:hypothetical protein
MKHARPPSASTCFAFAVALLALQSLSSPAFAAEPNPADYPLSLDVLSFQRQVNVRDMGYQTQTNCAGSGSGTGTATTYDGGQTYNVNANVETTTRCSGSTQHVQYVYRGADMQVKIGDRIYVVECMSRLPGVYSKLSKCAPILPGTYRGRWRSNGQLEILTTKPSGKLVAVGYTVMSANVVEPAAPIAPTTPSLAQQPSASTPNTLDSSPKAPLSPPANQHVTPQQPTANIGADPAASPNPPPAASTSYSGEQSLGDAAGAARAKQAQQRKQQTTSQ